MVISFIIGCALGAIIVALFFVPKVRKIDTINKEVQEENQKLATANEQLKTKKQSLLEQIEVTEALGQKVYDNALQLAQERLDQEATKLGQEYQENEKLCKEMYLSVMEEATSDIVVAIDARRQELALVEAQLGDLQAKMEAVVAANLREEEKCNKAKFFMLSISDVDKGDIKKLRDFALCLRNPRPIFKAIWETYFRTPTNELVNRIVSADGRTGIYKITCLLDQKIYIGQSVDLKERIKQHIKYGVGVDTPTNKLYVAMLANGVENYSFEIVEYCSQEQLNEKERFWIDYYKSNSYGYNMTSGNV